MNYHPASQSDASLLATMNWQLIRDEGHRNQMTLPELEARMAQWLTGEYQAVLFQESNQTVGYALFRREPEYVYLRQFFIVRESRRNGYGRDALSWLRRNEWRGQRVRVEVLLGNSGGIAFWRAVGFVDYSLTLEMEPGTPRLERVGVHRPIPDRTSS
jgi:predicted acetyltransferase